MRASCAARKIQLRIGQVDGVVQQQPAREVVKGADGLDAHRVGGAIADRLQEVQVQRHVQLARHGQRSPQVGQRRVRGRGDRAADLGWPGVRDKALGDHGAHMGLAADAEAVGQHKAHPGVLKRVERAVGKLLAGSVGELHRGGSAGRDVVQRAQAHCGVGVLSEDDTGLQHGEDTAGCPSR